MTLFHIFVNLLDVSCSRTQVDFHVCSTFHLHYMLSWLKQMKKSQSHSCTAAKGRIFKFFQIIVDIFSLILQQNLTSVCFF